MDLRFCPSCGQSVLDEDAKDCPFCGASMSGKPGAAKPAPKSAAPTDKKSIADKKSSKKSSGGAKSEKSAEDDPFGIEELSNVKAIQASPKPAKGRSHRVVCPMCDVQGFIPSKAAGRDVRCSNKDCLVPVFKAPKKGGDDGRSAPGAKAVEENSGTSPVLLYGGIGAAVLLVGGVTLFMLSGGSEDPGGGFEIPPPDDNPGGNQQVVVQPKEAEVEVDLHAEYLKIRDALLEETVSAARHPTANRDTAYCRRLTADSYALAGEFPQVENELKQRLLSSRSYNRIQPRVRVAWMQLRAGDTEAAKQTVSNARKAAAKLPKNGRAGQDALIYLAAGLVSVGQPADAEKAFERNKRDDTDANSQGAIASAAIVLMRESQVAGLTRLDIDSIPLWKDPLRSAVAAVLASNDFEGAAIEWAKSQSDEVVRSDALAAVLTVATRKAIESSDLSGVLESLESLSNEKPATVIRLNAVVCRELHGTRLADQSAPLLAKAKELWAGISPGEPASMPSIKRTNSYRLPKSAAFENAAMAGAELVAAAGLAKDKDATGIVDKAMTIPFPIAPRFEIAGRRELDAKTDSGFRSTYAKARGIIGQSSRIASELAAYRRKCQAIREAAERRRDLVVHALTLASLNGLHEHVWALAEGDTSIPIMDTDVVWFAADGYLLAGDSETSESKLSALRKAGKTMSSGVQTRRIAERRIRQGRVPSILAAVNESEANPQDRVLSAVEIALELSRAKDVAATKTFLKGLSGQAQEEAADIVACDLILQSDAPIDVQKELRDLNLPATSQAGLLHGMSVGFNDLLRDETK